MYLTMANTVEHKTAKEGSLFVTETRALPTYYKTTDVH